MRSRISSVRAAWIVAIVATSAASLRADSSDVAGVALDQAAVYLQLGPSNIFYEPHPFAVIAGTQATASGGILGASVSLPGGQQLALPQTAADEFEVVQRFDTLEQANAAFPGGTYFFSIDTATPPSPFTATLNLANRFPTAIPQMLNTEWSSIVVQFDVRKDFTFEWNDFPDFNIDSAHPSSIHFLLADVFNNELDSEFYLNPITGLTYPAGSFTPGIYVGRLMFANADLAASGSTTLLADSFRITEFIISAVDGPPVMTSPTTITVNQGQLLVYTLDATNLPGHLDNVTNLPDGVTFSPNGTISGYPTTPGTYQLGLSFSNLIGTGTATVTVNVLPPAALAITSSTRAAARVDEPFRFQVLAPGGSTAARLTASQLPPGLNTNAITGEITGTPTTPGDYTVQLRVTDGSAVADGVLFISVKEDPAFPAIVSATTATVTPGQPFSYRINAAPKRILLANGEGSNAADDPTYSLSGPLPAGLSFDAKTGTISGRFQGAAQREHDSAKSPLSGGAVVGNVQLFATNSRGTSTVPLVFLSSPVGAVNISTRMPIGAEPNLLIGGFIVTGNAPKKLVIRALGPSLPVGGAMQDPVLEIHAGDGTVLASNDNWHSDDPQSIIDSQVPPTSDAEAAIVAAFQPGGYTAIVHGKDGTTGVGQLEIYDLGTAAIDASSDAKLANISTRGFVQTGDNVMIGGFIISQAQRHVIVRAIGPSLASAGVSGALADTTLELHGGNGELLAMNDDWQSDPTEAQQVTAAKLSPRDPHESAVAATLDPGHYTAIVKGKNDMTGVGLVEVYVLD